CATSDRLREAEWMSGRIQHYLPGRSRLVFSVRGAEPLRLGYRRIEIIVAKIQVHLLAAVLSRPCWRHIVLDRLQEDQRPVLITKVVETLLLMQGQTCHVPVELAELLRVGAIDVDCDPRCDSQVLLLSFANHGEHSPRLIMHGI